MLKQRVVVVDDHTDERAIAIALLTHAGYEAIGLNDARQLLERVDDLAPDLVIMDLMMPEVDGLTAADLLRALPSGRAIPILLHTAYSDVHRDRLRQREHELRVLPKPATPAELTAAVEELIGPPVLDELLERAARDERQAPDPAAPRSAAPDRPGER
jgi:CheY-like chemotaxis protein